MGGIVGGEAGPEMAMVKDGGAWRGAEWGVPARDLAPTPFLCE